MASCENCFSTQLIDGDGTFNVVGIEKFAKETELEKCGISYVVVSVLGPQSSGKSTLVNRLFGTNFGEMDASQGRDRTTKGIWIAKCDGIEPLTLVLDLEGTDGRERAEEDDTTFEKQSALFALAVSDVVLINIWCHDIGREHAANKPLLKIVFQAMVKLFTPRKKTLLFVIRDKTKTPLEHLEARLLEDIQKIWDTVTKPKDIREAPLREYFCIKVVALSNYEDKEEKFKEEVASLRQRFSNSIGPDGLVGDWPGVDPASGISFSYQQIWGTIKEEKDLHLPALQVMVATALCERIANDAYDTLVAKEEWHQLEEQMKNSPTSGFVNKLNQLLRDCLSKYDAEAAYYHEATRSKYRDRLLEKLLQLFRPPFVSALEHIGFSISVEFKDSFNNALNGGEKFSLAAKMCFGSCMSRFDRACADVVVEQANNDKTEVRGKLWCDIGAHITSVRAARISELISSCQEKLKEALSGPVAALLAGAARSTWPSIRNCLRHEIESSFLELSAALTELDMNTGQELILGLEDCATGVVEEKARAEAGRVQFSMMDRFKRSFSHDSNSMPRVWRGKEDIQDIAKTGFSAALEVLSVLAAIRLSNDDTDNIEETLKVALVGSSNGGVNGRSTQELDPLARNAWEQVPPHRTLITPLHCKQLWDQFTGATNDIISNAEEQKETARKNSRWSVSKLAPFVSVAVGFAGLITGVTVDSSSSSSSSS